MTADEIPELILRPSRVKTICYLLLSIVFTVVGAWLTGIDGGRVIGWIGVVFFGLGVLVFLAMLLPNASYLKIDRVGFTVCTPFKASHTPWADVESFRVGSIRGHKMVMLRLAPHIPRNRLHAISVAISGYEGGLSDTYGMSAEDLATLLNECRRLMG